MSNVYVAPTHIAAAPLALPAPVLPKMTKRAFAIQTLEDNYHLLETHGARVLRKTCIDAILAYFPGTSQGSVGAIFNDAKHILVNAGAIEPFGRHGMGRNKHSKKPEEQQEEPKAYEVPADHKWVVIDKETREIVGSAESKNKASKLKQDTQTVQKYLPEAA